MALRSMHPLLLLVACIVLAIAFVASPAAASISVSDYSSPLNGGGGSRSESLFDVPDASRDALCLFARVTNSASWTSNSSWCDDGVPVCEWYGVGCDASGAVVTRLLLDNTALSLAQGETSINALWTNLPGLLELDLSGNGDLGTLDLSALTSLQYLTLSRFNMFPGQPRPPVTQLVLPLNSALLEIDVSSSGLQVDFTRVPSLKEFYAANNYAPHELHGIWSCPQLVFADFVASGVRCSTPAQTLDGNMLQDGALTQWILSNLGRTNAALETLLLSSARSLDFGAASAASGGSNVPRVVAPNLATLALSQLPQLVTSPSAGGFPPANWLSGMPLLQKLVLALNPDVCVDLSAFADASLKLSYIDLTATCVRGSLSVLTRFPDMATVRMDDSGLDSTLPNNIATVWPKLQVITLARCNLRGSLPSFASLPQLQYIRFTSNAFSGPLAPDFLRGSELVEQVYLEHNLLSGPLPASLVAPNLVILNLQDNEFSGGFPLDAGAWDLPTLSTLNLAGLPLGSPQAPASIPAGFWERFPKLNVFDASYCGLSGPVPPARELRYFGHFALVGNFLTGRLPTNVTSMHFDLSSNQLEGPIVIPLLTHSLQFLHLSNNKALSCPILLSEHVGLEHLELQNAGISGCDFSDRSQVDLPHQVSFVDISDNDFSPLALEISPGWGTVRALRAGVVSFHTRWDGVSRYRLANLDVSENRLDPARQSESLNTLAQFAATLLSFSCSSCGLTISVNQLSPPFSASNTGVSLTRVLQSVNLANNDLHGMMSPTSFSWAVPEASADGLIMEWPLSLESLDLSSNPRITGMLPVARAGYSRLHSLNLARTGVQGELPESWRLFTALRVLDVSDTGVRCALSQAAGVQRAGAVSCKMPSWITVTPLNLQVPLAGAGGAAAQANSSELIEGVRCPQLISSRTPLSSMTIDTSYYASTLCTCSEGYFGEHGNCVLCPLNCQCSGTVVRECFPLLSLGSASRDPSSGVLQETLPVVHALLPCPRTIDGKALCNPNGVEWPTFYAASSARNGSMLGATAPMPASSGAQSWCAEGYTGRLCSECSEGFYSAGGRLCSACRGRGAHAVILLMYLLLLVCILLTFFFMSPRTMPDFLSGGETDASRAASVGSSVLALKMLVYHCQNLSLLLFTNTSLPVALAGLLSFMYAGSTGMSLANFVGLECLGKEWTLVTRAWLSLAAPLVILSMALAVRVAAHSREWSGRAYASCISTLQLLAFPCALVSLSSLSCQSNDSQGRDSEYLNLYSYYACDATWKSDLRPPAALGVVWWFVLFPAGMALLLWRSKRAVAQREKSVGPVCASLLGLYVSRAWSYDLVVLARRLALVLVVCVVPASSIYLPLAFIAIIQLAAMWQNWALPHRSPWVHCGELFSLYLLLLNYLSALIFQASTGVVGPSIAAGVNDPSVRWAHLLVVVNVVFLAALVAALFSPVRVVAKFILLQIFRALVWMGCLPSEEDKFERLARSSMSALALGRAGGSQARAHSGAATSNDDDGDEPAVSSSSRAKPDTQKESLANGSAGDSASEVVVEMR